MDRSVKDMSRGTPPTFVCNTEVHDEVYSPHRVCHHVTSPFTDGDRGNNSQNKHT
jgi:hypothetical protein